MSAKKIHPSMARVYEAATAIELITGTFNQAYLSAVLNVSPQVVNNWESRGISKDGRLKIQQMFGINATWIESGLGDMIVNQSRPRTHALPSTVDDKKEGKNGHGAVLSRDEQTLIDGFRLMGDEMRESWLEAARNKINQSARLKNSVA